MYDLIRSNKRRSVLLIVAFIAVVAVIGFAFGLVFGNGIAATIVALVIGAIVAFTSYWKADKIALAVSRARPADPQQYARLHNIVEGLCIAGGLPKPGVYVIDDPAPNAFATGRDPKHAAIAVTTGLLEKMNRVELEGVVAHELSHIRNYDILISTLAVTVVGASVVAAMVAGAASVVDEAASSSPPEQAASTRSSAATMAAAMAVRVRITVPSTMRCALRAADACRTSDEVRRGDRCHPPRSSVARSTSVP